ncbi:MAG: hypothetical protein VX007_10055, partial [Pseudomonadota bacterium]|nr:hypothetical protein [Pseudomonadota bacterium]
AGALAEARQDGDQRKDTNQIASKVDEMGHGFDEVRIVAKMRYRLVCDFRASLVFRGRPVSPRLAAAMTFHSRS